MYHIFSTLANPTRYVKYGPSVGNAINIAERDVLIKGGHGVNQKNIGTPMGIYTGISDDDYEWLKDDPSFKQHMANGYISVQKRQVNSEVAAADMVTHDRKSDACPIVPQDFSDKEAGKDLTAIVPKVSKAA